MDLPPGIPDQDDHDSSTESTTKNTQIDTIDESKEGDETLSNVGKNDEEVLKVSDGTILDTQNVDGKTQEEDSLVSQDEDSSTSQHDNTPQVSDGVTLDAQNNVGNVVREDQTSISEDFSNVDISKMNVTKEEIDEIFDIFTLYDRNGDGVITESDLAIVIESMQKYKPTKDQVRRAIRSMIPHHEGQEVDFASFVWYKLHDRQLREKSANSKDIIEAFRHFDKDNDGFWNIDDLRYMFNQIDLVRTEDQLVETLKEVDVDGDGKISFEDFRKTMTSFIPNSLKVLNLRGLSWRRHSVMK